MIVVLTGVSGVGKTTIASILEQNYGFFRSISHTTRKKREGEEDFKDYVFIGKHDFRQKIKSGFFLEFVEQFNNFYGTSYEQIQKLLDAKKPVIMCISPEGFLATKGKWPEKVLGIYLLPPSVEELTRRVHARAGREHTCDDRLKALCDTSGHEEFEHKIGACTIEETLKQVLALIDDFRSGKL